MPIACDLVLSPAHLDLAAAGVRLRGGAPAAVLADAAGAATTLAPLGAPTVVASTVPAFVGPLVTSTWTWALAGGHRLLWRVGRAAADTSLTIETAFVNGADAPVRLRELLLFAGGDDSVTTEGEPAAWWLSTLAHSRRLGDLARVLPSANDDERSIWAGFGLPVPFPLPADERATDGRWRRFGDYLTLFTDRGRRGLAIGAVGEPRADLRLDCRVDAGRVRLEIASEMTDVLVEPGETRWSQQVAFIAGDHDGSVTTLLRWCADGHGARVHRAPAAGWCSWYSFGNAVAAADVEALAETVRARGAELPMPVIQIDDGFQRTVGDWACSKRFPAGLAPVIQRIRAAGAEPGIWLAPLAVHESLGLHAREPAWFQRDAGGALTGEANNWGPRSRWLDPTHPGATAFIGDIVREHRRLGFTYFKIDFNTISGVSTANPGGARLHDPRLTRLQALRGLYRRYRELMGEDAYLLACVGSINRGVLGYADAARIGPDSAANWRAAHPCTITDCIRAVGTSALANGIWFANDPDVTYTKPRGELGVDEVRTWSGFVGLLGGLALISEPMHVGDQLLARVELERTAEHLRLRAEVREASFRRHADPWREASLEVFGTAAPGAASAPAIAQFFLLPDCGGEPALARCADAARTPAPEIAVRSRRVDGGYALEAEIPLPLLGGAGCRVEVKVNAAPTGGQRHERTLGGSHAAYVDASRFSTLPSGRRVGTVVVPGHADSARDYQILVPPTADHGRSWHAGSDPDHCQFGAVTRRPWGAAATIQLFNPADHAADLELDARGLDELGPRVHLWSFWDERHLGVVDAARTVVVRGIPGHGSRLLRLTPAADGMPTLIGSTLHISAGGTEVRAIAATPQRLTIDLADAGARDGALWLHHRGDLRLASATGCTAGLDAQPDDLWRLAIASRRTGGQRLVLTG